MVFSYRSFKSVVGVFFAFGIGCGYVSSAAADPIMLPPGFSQAPLDLDELVTLCPQSPPPYTGSLMITSKYEGSDDSRSTLNQQAYQLYLQQTADIAEFQKLLAAQSTKYLYQGNPSVRWCTLKLLYDWAKASALTSSETSVTGCAMRKLALSAASVSYAKLIAPEGNWTSTELKMRRRIEGWLLNLAGYVIADYTETDLTKVNNHDYWAAWAVGITGAVLQRRDLFDWSYGKFNQAMSQVDANGFLPNELRREQLALSYHNYAVAPLVSLGVLLSTNRYAVLSLYDHALTRLVKKTVAGINRPEIFQQANGFAQDTGSLMSCTGIAWLEPWTVLNPGVYIPLNWKPMRPLMYSRLGGDLTLLYTQTKY